MNTLRHLLIALVALVLVAALAFLYDKTQAVDLRERNDIAALLDTLREIDGRWDIDILRERTELDPNQLAAPNRTATARKALAGLSTAQQRSGATIRATHGGADSPWSGARQPVHRARAAGLARLQ